MALGLAKAGADVVIASRKLDACEAVVAEVEALGVRGLALATRMGEPDDMAALVAATVERFGRLDIVINNAATVLDRPLDTLDPAAFQGAFATNLLGPLLLVKAAAPHMEAGGHGAVVNIISIAVDGGSPGRYLYPPVKAGLQQATKSLALDLAPKGIRVNAISPGTFVTDMVTKAFDGPTLTRIAKQTPLGRLGDPDELAGVVLLLVSDAGSYITGETITVDGGVTVM